MRAREADDDKKNGEVEGRHDKKQRQPAAIALVSVKSNHESDTNHGCPIEGKATDKLLPPEASMVELTEENEAEKGSPQPTKHAHYDSRKLQEQLHGEYFDSSCGDTAMGYPETLLVVPVQNPSAPHIDETNE